MNAHSTPAELIQKVEKCVTTAPPGAMTVSDLEDFQKMLKAWRGLCALGTGFKWAVTSLGLVATFAASLTYLYGLVTGGKP